MCNRHSSDMRQCAEEGSALIRLGCERLFDQQFRSLLEGRKIGLVTNYTGVDSRLRRTIDRLLESGVKVTTLFTAEHGFYGVSQAGELIANEKDIKTDIDIVSLYDENKQMSAQMLEGVELILLEFQDVGARFYTYVSTMFRVMSAVAEAGIPMIVLDRPNPIGGQSVEGAGVEDGYRSFVGEYDLPIRHGMTFGELASFYRHHEIMNLDLRVIPMEGWSRSMLYPETGLQWIPPSPNMPTFEAARIYPGTCFFEGTNLSEGRGTTMPFQWIGAPWIRCQWLADELNQIGLSGVHFRPVVFMPVYSKHAGVRVEGVHVHILDYRNLSTVSIGLHMIATIKRMFPTDFGWLPPNQDRYFIDLLWGSSRYREDFDKGRQVTDIIKEWEEKAGRFMSRRISYLLYS